MKEMLNFLIKNIISSDEFSIEEKIEENTTVFTVILDEKFLGPVIGRGGKVANAIRTLLKSYCKGKQRVIIKFEGK